MSLKALANTGYSSRASAALTRCISSQDNSVEIRLAALQAATHLSCQENVSNLHLVCDTVLHDVAQ